MKNFPLYFIALGILISFISCNRDVEYFDSDVVFLGHKGAGSNTVNTTTPENTLAAVTSGAKMLDGVEVDIQLSKDGTIWLQHNFNVNDFNKIQNLPPAFIPLMSDADISKIEIVRGGLTSKLTKLSEIVDYWNANGRNFYISLDIKNFAHEELADGSSVYSHYPGGQSAYFTNTAVALNNTFKQGPFQKLMLEFNSSELMSALNQQPVAKDIPTFLTYESLELSESVQKAVSTGYDGISWNYKLITPAMIADAKSKGLLVNLYTGTYLSELRAMLDLNPHFVQTDVVTAKEDLYIR